MIVDCHTHISFAADDVEASEHLAAAQAVDACIVLAAANGQTEEANNKLAEYVGKHKEKMVGFAAIEPTKDKINAKNLVYIREKLGLNGMVLYCCACGFHPAHSRAMRLYESAQELGIACLLSQWGPVSKLKGGSRLCPAIPFG